MLKKQFLYGFIALLTLGACGSEDELLPEEVKDWYVIRDSDNEVIHRTYELYKQYGVAIYVNDTLGSENRGKDAYGKDVIYHELFNPFYNIFSSQASSHYALCHDEDACLKAVNALGKYVLPNMIPVLNRAILLCDTLVTPDYGGRPELNTWVFSSPTGFAVGKLYEMNHWSDREIRFWAGMVLAPEVYDWFSIYCEEEMIAFQDITGYKEDGSTHYGTSYAYTVINYEGMVAYQLDAEWKKTHMKLADFYLGKADGIDTTIVFHMEQFGILDFPTRENITRDVNQKEKGIHYSLLELEPTLELANPDSLVAIFMNRFEPKSDLIVDRVERWVPGFKFDLMNYIAAVYAYDEAEFREIYCVESETAEKLIAKYKLMDEMLKKYEVKKGITRKPFYEMP